MMFFITALLLQLVTGFPTPVTLPRSCTTLTPKSLQALDNAYPELPFRQGGVFSGKSNLMIMHNNVNATNPAHSLQLIEFQVPQHATQCQLEISDPACSLSYTNNDDYEMSSPVQLRVISLHANALPANRTYNDVFVSEPSVVSSWDFGDANMSAGDTRIFNSEACPAAAVDGEDGSLYYVLDYENPIEGFSEMMMLQQNADVEKGVELNGVYLTYC